MNCKVIQDLLPLYIDGLTSEESNNEIEKHLNTCKECKACYQEMTGEINEPVSLGDEEIRDVEIIKKIKQRNRKRIIIGVTISIVMIFAVIMFIYPHTYSQVKYKDVELTYGVKEDEFYFTMTPKAGYSVVFSGTASGNDSYLKVLSLRRVFGSEDSIKWRSEIGTEEEPYRLTLEFRDKIIIFQNGVLVEEKSK